MKHLPLHLMIALGMAAAGVAAPGCSDDPKLGYTMKSLYRDDVKSVAVPIWARGRNVYRREVEMRLTEALVKRIQLDTSYKVTEKPRADTILEGTIDRIDQQVLSKNPDTGRPRELDVTFVLSFTWTDLRTGKVLAKESNFKVAGTYSPEEPLGDGYFQERRNLAPAMARRAPEKEDFFLGSEDVINRAARLIVEKMEAEW